MIYLFVNGNCGNQFFQYAFAKVIADQTGQKLSICWKDEQDKEMRNQLKDFQVEVAEDLPYEVRTWKRTLFYKLRALLCKEDTTLFDTYDRKWAPFFEKLGVYIMYHGYYPFEIKKHKNYYLTGYFENPKYFDAIKTKLQEQFTPRRDKLPHNHALYEKIEQTESVCLTIRRGDFLSEEYKQNFFVCDEKYFYEAVSVMRQKKKNMVLFVFSDDVEWVKKHMQFEGIETYYEKGDDPIWEKIRLMYSCKNFIISNSTFSWWAQYLSKNPDKVVIAPDVWRRDDPYAKEIYQKDWIVLNTQR